MQPSGVASNTPLVYADILMPLGEWGKICPKLSACFLRCTAAAAANAASVARCRYFDSFAI